MIIFKIICILLIIILFYLIINKNIEKFINHIIRPLDFKILNKEKKILKEEVEENENNT